MSFLGFIRGAGNVVKKVATTIISSPLDDIAIGILDPAALPWWQEMEKKIVTVETKYQGLDGQSAVKKAEVLATDPDSIALINQFLALSGQQMVGDPALVGKAIDDTITSKNSIMAAAKSWKIVPVAPAQVPTS